jgi:outer membrane protein assembly factor BamB
MKIHRALPALLLSVTASAADWPQFRGPNGLGVSNDRGLPVEFGPQKNVVWKTPLPPGHSSPILVGPHIFVTAYEGEKLLTIGLDRKTGKILWTREAPRPRKEFMQQTNTPASGSPVSDGANVYVFFGDFGIICYSVDGEERWKLPLGPFNNANGHGTSPVLIDDMLVLICDQDTDSYVLALDKTTGKQRYRIERSEVTRSYSIPTVYRPRNGPAELIIPGSYQTMAYNLATGEKLWWVRGGCWQQKSAAVLDGDILYVSCWESGGDAATPPETPTFEEALAKYDADRDGRLTPAEIVQQFRNFGEFDLDRDHFLNNREWSFYRARTGSQNSLIAIRAGGRGDVTGKRVLWRFRKSLPNVPSPLLYQGILYLVKDGGVLTTVNPRTGEAIRQERLRGALDRYWASPVAGDGKVYLLSESGKLTVLRAGEQWDTMAVNDLEDTCFSTPAIADSRLYVRTRSALYCFGK